MLKIIGNYKIIIGKSSRYLTSSSIRYKLTKLIYHLYKLNSPYYLIIFSFLISNINTYSGNIISLDNSAANELFIGEGL